MSRLVLVKNRFEENEALYLDNEVVLQGKDLKERVLEYLLYDLQLVRDVKNIDIKEMQTKVIDSKTQEGLDMFGYLPDNLSGLNFL